MLKLTGISIEKALDTAVYDRNNQDSNSLLLNTLNIHVVPNCQCILFR